MTKSPISSTPPGTYGTGRYSPSSYCGLRVSELCRLIYADEIDVDLDDRILYIRNRGHETTKNRKERQFLISDELEPYFSKWIDARRNYLVKQGATGMSRCTAKHVGCWGRLCLPQLQATKATQVNCC